MIGNQRPQCAKTVPQKSTSGCNDTCSWINTSRCGHPFRSHYFTEVAQVFKMIQKPRNVDLRELKSKRNRHFLGKHGSRILLSLSPAALFVEGNRSVDHVILAQLIRQHPCRSEKTSSLRKVMSLKGLACVIMSVFKPSTSVVHVAISFERVRKFTGHSSVKTRVQGPVVWRLDSAIHLALKVVFCYRVRCPSTDFLISWIWKSWIRTVLRRLCLNTVSS